MHLKTYAATAAALVLATANIQAQEAPDSARMMRTLGELADDAMQGRLVNTEGSVRAQGFITGALLKIGVKPFSGNRFAQPFKFAGRGATADSTPGTNLIGMITGSKYPNRYIVISAHYDHKGIRHSTATTKAPADSIFNGADDNASGTAGILELASYFAKHQPQHSIIFAFFDAEESGDRGSRAFVASSIMPNKDSVIIDLNLDMVGRNVSNELYAAGTTPYPQLLPYVQEAAKRSGLKLLTGHDGAPGKDDWTNQSDHGAFHAKKIPYLYFGEEDHPDYHQLSDHVSGIMPGFYVSAIRTVLDIAKQIDAKPPAATRSK
jgi:Zn-dependent M28 family amino/carboxypeptidase